MTGTGIDPQMASAQVDKQDLIRFKQQMDGLKQRLSNGDSKEDQLRAACENFEAVFISKLWKEMKSTVPKEGYLHSKQEDMYMGMFDQEFAEKMSHAGGIGLADMIYDQLSQKLKDTSRSTLAGGVSIEPVEAQPMPLQKAQPMPVQREAEMTLEDWGGSAEQGAVEEVSAVVGSAGDAPAAAVTDPDVKEQLDALTRRLEARRIKEQLLGSQGTYEKEKNGTSGAQLGRNIAKIG